MKREPSVHIPFFEEINDFLEATKVPDRTDDPLFYCMRLQRHQHKIYMPPFRRGFYFVGLINIQNETTVTYNNNNEAISDSFIVFQSPNLLYSFYTASKTSGYLIYFKEELLSFFKPNIQDEFPFFNVLNTTLFQLDKGKYLQLAAHCENLFHHSDEQDNLLKKKINSLKLLTLLYELLASPIIAESLILDTHIKKDLVNQFIQHVNVHYPEKRTIKEYAEMLSISEDHLAKSVKSETGKTAYSFIVDRTIKEVKSLIAFTGLSYSEIAYQLNFSDTSNFSKYFKRNTGLSPTEYRNQYRNS